MKTMFFKLEQIKKNGNSVTLNLPKFEADGLVKAEEAAKDMLEHIALALQLQADTGQKNVKVGGVTFSLGSKFTLYLNVDGLDYSLDDCIKLATNQDTEQSSFRNGGSLFVQMYRVIRMTQGQTEGLTMEAKKLVSRNAQNLLN